MTYILALHMISFVAWFAGLFYLPRLFVYHTPSTDTIGIERFKIMERKLYYFIMWPAALLTIVSGVLLLSFKWSYFIAQGWMIVKLISVALLFLYHVYCGHLVKCFARNGNSHSEKFYRFFNEIPTVLLIVIVIMAIVNP